MGVKQCEGCKMEASKFEHNLALRPTDKPRGALEGWSIDLITNLAPSSAESYRHCIVAVDCFTKWTEIGKLRTKSSEEVG